MDKPLGAWYNVNMSGCICNPQTEKERLDLESYGCPEEICPCCYNGKEHDDPYCPECLAYLENAEEQINAAPEPSATIREMDKILYIMQGVPGSGKSTVAKMIGNQERLEGKTVAHLSTDDWRFDDDGVYQFDPADNARYHKMCQKACAEAMVDGIEVIIIDNTNIQEWQAHPYLVMADSFGYTVQVVSVDATLDLSIRRQKDRKPDRRVPPEVIARMYFEMERIIARPDEEQRWVEFPEQMSDVYQRGWEE